MKRWLVVSPEYGEVVPILDYGEGPLEYGADVIEIEAETRRDALVLGVKAMRADPEKYHWFRDCDHPYAGVKVEETWPMCLACEGTGQGAIHGVDGECSACNGTGIEPQKAVDSEPRQA